MDLKIGKFFSLKIGATEIAAILTVLLGTGVLVTNQQIKKREHRRFNHAVQEIRPVDYRTQTFTVDSVFIDSEDVQVDGTSITPSHKKERRR